MLKRLCITVMIPSVMFLCPLVVSADGGVNYIGELCVHVNEYGSFAPSALIARLGVLSYGEGRHFALHGRFVKSGGLLHGTAEINDDGEIVISLTGTGTTVKAADDLPQPGSSTTLYSIHMVVTPLTPSTMTGHYRAIGSSWENQRGTPVQPVEQFNRGLMVALTICN